MTERQPIPEWVKTAGSLTLLYATLWWGFSKDIKRQVYEEQGGVSPEGKPIEEYHHIVPEKALRGQGIRGKNVRENCVGLSFEEHKHKWDRLMFEGIFYPGVTIDQIDKETYVSGHFARSRKRRKRKR